MIPLSFIVSVFPTPFPNDHVPPVSQLAARLACPAYGTLCSARLPLPPHYCNQLFKEYEQSFDQVYDTHVDRILFVTSQPLELPANTMPDLCAATECLSTGPSLKHLSAGVLVRVPAFKIVRGAHLSGDARPLR